MSEKNSFPFDIPELPDSVDNALKNLSDAPTKSIGQTLSDAWFLVFGGISHQANKRRICNWVILDLAISASKLGNISSPPSLCYDFS